MVIAPHPDDETLGCGAVIARLRAEGRAIRIVIVTDGGAQDSAVGAEREALVALRRAEAQKAAEVLGLTAQDVVFLNYKDGKAAASKEEIRRDLEAQIDQLAPSIVFSPSNYDFHHDHRAISEAIDQLQDSGKINFRSFHYPIWYRTVEWPYGLLRCLWAPTLLRNTRVVRAEGYRTKKWAALEKYPSQFRMSQNRGQLIFCQRHCQSKELFFERVKGQGARERY